MKLVCISDTHNTLKHVIDKIPDGDVLIHAGDATSFGRAVEITDFAIEMDKLPHKYKIFIPGNHDVLFETDERLARKILGPNIHCLIDEALEIDGVKFWGAPWQPAFCDWAFNMDDYQLETKWKEIPDEVDVLITHGPPYAIGDLCPDGPHGLGLKNTGCKHLRKQVMERVRPKVHIYGHIHEGYGSRKINDIHFINASLLDGRYRIANKPINFSIEFYV